MIALYEQNLNETDVQNICRLMIRGEIKGNLVQLNLGRNRIEDVSIRVLAAAIIGQSSWKSCVCVETKSEMKVPSLSQEH